MLSKICAEIKNYFTNEEDRHIGDFEIIGGQIVPSILIQDGQYYRIVGSIFNDGVHKYGDASDILKDEPKFHGAIWCMRVPKEILTIADEIAAWELANANVISSPYASESFAGYSYTLKTGNDTQGSEGADWTAQKNFAKRLNPYRKLRSV